MTYRAWYFDDDKAKDVERAQLRLDIDKLIEDNRELLDALEASGD